MSKCYSCPVCPVCPIVPSCFSHCLRRAGGH